MLMINIDTHTNKTPPRTQSSSCSNYTTQDSINFDTGMHTQEKRGRRLHSGGEVVYRQRGRVEGGRRRRNRTVNWLWRTARPSCRFVRLALGSQASATRDVLGDRPEYLVEDLVGTDVQDLAHRVQPPIVLVDRPCAVSSTHTAQTNRLGAKQVCSMHCSLAGLQQPRLRIADVSRTRKSTDGAMAPGVARQVAVRTLGRPSHAFAERAGERGREAPVGKEDR